MTETKLWAAGRTEAKAGGADGLATDRQIERPGRRRAAAARAQAGLPLRMGSGCRRRRRTGWGSEGQSEELAGGSPWGSVRLRSWDRVRKLHARAAQNVSPATPPPPFELDAD